MRERSEITVKAKTLEAAIREAATQLDVDEDDVEYKIVSQSAGKGVLFFFGRKVEILAWKRAADKLEKKQQKTSLDDDQMSDLVDDLRGFCEKICSLVAGEPVVVSAEQQDGRLVLDIENDFIAEQMAKNGKFSESIERLLRKKPRYLKRELPFRIFVDAKRLRQGREEGLVELAQDLSNKVNANKKPIILNYKSPNDRRIIHMALDKDERVYTKSIGSGSNRKLMILPAKGKDELVAGAKRGRDYPEGVMP